MQLTGSEIVIECLKEQGVDTNTFNLFSGILIEIISPSSTKAIGPPTAASGET